MKSPEEINQIISVLEGRIKMFERLSSELPQKECDWIEDGQKGLADIVLRRLIKIDHQKIVLLRYILE